MYHGISAENESKQHDWSKSGQYSPELYYLIHFNFSYFSSHTNVNKYVPTHLGKGALHIRRPPPKQISSGAPSRRYPELQEKVKVSPMPKLYPFLRPNRGIPGSSHGSRVYSVGEKWSSVNNSDYTNQNYNWSTQFEYFRPLISAFMSEWCASVKCVKYALC